MTDLSEYVVDLDRESKDVQVIVAVTKPGKTLSDTIREVDSKVAEWKRAGARLRGIGPNDTLLVPNLSWRIHHSFKELEGKAVVNGVLSGMPIVLAEQTVAFRLDRSGAELGSEAKVEVSPIPTHYDFNRPFLILMKKRGAARPFFAMWVNNAELLEPWPTR